MEQRENIPNSGKKLEGAKEPTMSLWGTTVPVTEPLWDEITVPDLERADLVSQEVISVSERLRKVFEITGGSLEGRKTIFSELQAVQELLPQYSAEVSESDLEALLTTALTLLATLYQDNDRFSGLLCEKIFSDTKNTDLEVVENLPSLPWSIFFQKDFIGSYSSYEVGEVAHCERTLLRKLLFDCLVESACTTELLLRPGQDHGELICFFQSLCCANAGTSVGCDCVINLVEPKIDRLFEDFPGSVVPPLPVKERGRIIGSWDEVIWEPYALNTWIQLPKL